MPVAGFLFVSGLADYGLLRDSPLKSRNSLTHSYHQVTDFRSSERQDIAGDSTDFYEITLNAACFETD